MGACCVSNGSPGLQSPLDRFHHDKPLLLLALDFDQTITQKHLFFELNGSSVLSDSVTDKRLTAIFGGERRLNRLQTHFEAISSKIEHIVIISFGFEDVITRALERVNMLQHFSMIIGNDTDRLKNVHNNKTQCLKQLVQEYELCNHNVLFIDDDQSNVKPVYDNNVADTLLVVQRNGMNYNHMEIIEQRVAAVIHKDTLLVDDVDVNKSQDIDDETHMMDDIISQMHKESLSP
eukprot:32014_1